MNPSTSDSGPLAASRATTRSWLAFGVRLVGGLIFAGTGVAKEVSSSFHANWAAMVGELNLPLTQVAVQVTPVLEILTGVLLLLGLYARAAAVVGLLLMAGAAWVHLTVNSDALPTGLPPTWLPIVTALVCAFVAWRGAGALSLDLNSHRHSGQLTESAA